MTVAFDLRPYPPALAREDVRRGLTALLRRRVPGQEVDDLAQTILCDALASGSIPSDPEEMRRWLIGIARHKIADYHRRTARVNARSEGEGPLGSCASMPAAFEEREVLHRLLGAVESRRDAETMEWLVREHGGERLADIASENGMPAPVVRQRVSRLRRALRSRWAGAIGVLLLFLGAATALGVSRMHPLGEPAPAVTPIVPDRAVPMTTPIENDAPPAPLMEQVQGDWVVQAVRPARELTPNETKFVDLYSKNASMHVDGKDITIKANGFKETWHVTSVDGHRINLDCEHGAPEVAEVVVREGARGGREMELRLPNHPRLAGKLLLKRPVY
jgi:DNA-directed RNA polymerase specialized sigma24 family protein